MGCNFQCHPSPQMNLTIPKSGHKDFEIFYLPDFLQQRSVVRCEWSDGYECLTESGFIVKETDDKYVLITLPDNLKQTPGRFHWQISGLHRNGSFCSWIPKEICKATNDDFKLEDTSATVMLTNSSSSGDCGSQSQDDNTSININAVIGVTVVIILFLILGIFLLWRHRKNKCLTTESKISTDEENAVPDDSATNNHTKRSERNSDNSAIDEEIAFLGNKGDSLTQKKSEKNPNPTEGNSVM